MHMPYIPNNADTSNNQDTRRNFIYDLAAHRQKHVQRMRSGAVQPASNTIDEESESEVSVALTESETSDDSWLNDTRAPLLPLPHISSTSHKHVVHYEDLPTVSLMALCDNVRSSIQGQDTTYDLDATQRLPTRLGTQNSRRNRHVSSVRSSITKDFNDYGPIQALLENKHVSSITALGPQRIYVELRERCGVNGRTRQMQETPYRFQSEQHMLNTIENMLSAAGRTWPITCSLSDVRLPDGSLLSVSLPPAAMHAPTFTIRKPREDRYSLDDLVYGKMMDSKAADTLRAHVQFRRTICICGPAGSGKTTLLNALCMLIPDGESIVTIEEAASERKLYLPQSQVIALLTQQEADSERVCDLERGGDLGRGCNKLDPYRVTMRNALSHAHRMRAQRIIVSRCRGDDIPVLLRSMFDCSSGSIMTTMNAQNVQDCLSRLELSYLMHYLRGGSASQATPTLLALLRAQIARSLHVVVSLSAERAVVDIAEIGGRVGRV